LPVNTWSSTIIAESFSLGGELAQRRLVNPKISIQPDLSVADIDHALEPRLVVVQEVRIVESGNGLR
jgi:hypothetical protein